MWGELRKLRSNAAIRISLYILQGNRFAELRKLRSNAAIRISLYILQRNKFAELRKLRSNEAIRISLYTTGKQICRIAKVAKQRSNSYIIITLQGNKFAEL